MTQVSARTGVRASRVGLACGAFSVAAGLFVLLAWAAGWEPAVRLRAGHAAMPANSAVSVTLLGLGLVVGSRGHLAGARRLGVVAGILPALTLVQAAVGRSLGIDLLILGQAQRTADPGALGPGRMSPTTAAALLALALALALLWRWGPLAHGLAVAAMMVGHVSFIGYLYGAEQLERVGGASSVSEHTAVLLVVAGLGVIYLRPTLGLPALLAEPGLIGSLVRQFTAFAVLVPPVVGGARWAGQQAGWYGTPLGVAIMTLTWTFGLLALTWWGGRSTLSVERERDAALLHAVEARDRLALVADATATFVSTLELDQVLDRVTLRTVDALADGCSVRLLDHTGEELVQVTLRHRDPARQAILAEQFREPTRTDEGIAARVIESRRSYLVADVAGEASAGNGHPELVQRLVRGGMSSVIVAPLLYQDRVLGVIAVMRDQQPVPFDERDQAFVEGLAGRAALAIGNAEVVAKQRRVDAALTEFGRLALVAEDPVELGQRAVDLLHATLSARYALLMTGQDDGGLTVAAVAGPVGVQPVLARGASVEASVPTDVFATGVSVVCDDMRHDEAKGMVEMGTLLAADSGLAVPVPGDSGSRGVLAVTGVGVGRYADDDFGFVTTLAGFLATALDRVAAQRALCELAEERRVLLDRLVTVQEDERARIADGVHEDQVQVITAVDLRLGLLARHVSQHPDLAADVAFVREAVRDAASRLRDLLFDLQPPDAGVDLGEAIRSVAAHLLDGSPTSWEVLSETATSLSDGHLTTAYRIGKEALSNVGRHAGATEVRVVIADEDAGVLVCVSDNGVGMRQVPERSPAGHRGLSSMRDWAAVSGGWLRVESNPGRGTVVRYWLPSGL